MRHRVDETKSDAGRSPGDRKPGSISELETTLRRHAERGTDIFVPRAVFESWADMIEAERADRRTDFVCGALTALVFVLPVIVWLFTPA